MNDTTEAYTRGHNAAVSGDSPESEGAMTREELLERVRVGYAKAQKHAEFSIDRQLRSPSSGSAGVEDAHDDRRAIRDGAEALAALLDSAPVPD